LGLGAGVIADGWGPDLLVVPFLLFAVACWCLGGGCVGALGPVLLAGTFVGQVHLEYAPIIAAFVVVAGVGYWRTHEPGDASDERPFLRRHAGLLVCAAIAVVAWVPPLLDTVLPAGQRNLSRLATVVQGPAAGRVGAGNAIRFFAGLTQPSA